MISLYESLWSRLVNIPRATGNFVKGTVDDLGAIPKDLKDMEYQLRHMTLGNGGWRGGSLPNRLDYLPYFKISARQFGDHLKRPASIGGGILAYNEYGDLKRELRDEKMKNLGAEELLRRQAEENSTSKSSLGDLQDKVSDLISDHPYLSIGAALGVPVIAGATILARNKMKNK